MNFLSVNNNEKMDLPHFKINDSSLDVGGKLHYVDMVLVY